MGTGKISRRSFLGAASGGALGGSLCNGLLEASGNQPDTVKEPAREIPVAGEFDVLVVGGSCTGVFAAVAAARLGARVGIVEQNGFFGGVATASLVNIWHSPFDTVGERQIIGGLTMETVERLERRNAIGRGDATSSYFRLGTEDLKLVLDELVTGSGIRPFLHASYVTSLKRDKRNIEAVIIEDKSGRRALRASCYIDATGDGDLLERSGFATVRDPENIQPPTTCAILRGLDKVKERHPGFNLGKVVFDPQYPQALKRGFLWGAPVPGSSDFMLAGTRVFGADCSDADQLTNAEIEGRRQVRAVCDILRENFHEEGVSPLVALPTKIGIRESRHALCGYRLTESDVLGGVRFEDAIANGSYRVDIHLADREGLMFRYLDGREVFAGVDGNNEEGRWREPVDEDPTFYQIPYRCLLPLEADNLLCAGRIIDADAGAFGAVRVMVNCNQMGEAAGVAAALAVNNSCSVSTLDTSALRSTLARQGAIII